MRHIKITALSWTGLLLASFLSAQTPQGPDVTVNTRTGFPAFSQVAAAPNGAFVVTWEHKESTRPARRVWVRRFAASGRAQGREFPVSTSSPGAAQTVPQVAVAAGGNFLVVWETGNGIDRSVVLGRCFAASGKAFGPAFRLNPDSQGLEVSPAVAVAPDGSFVAVWTSGSNPFGYSDDILARRFTARGEPLGAAFKVVSPAGPYQNFPQVAVSGNGDFLIGWQSATGFHGSYNFGIAARRFDAEGHPLGDGFQVAPDGLNDVNGFAFAMTEDGEALFAWKGALPDTPPAGGEFIRSGILSRRISSDDSPVGTTVQVSETPFDKVSQEPPAVAALPGGGYFVTWSDGVVSPSTIFGQSLASDGTLRGSTLQINSGDASKGFLPAVAIAPSGQGIVTWTQSLRRSTQILLRRLTPN
jgi:hypothetical protein